MAPEEQMHLSDKKLGSELRGQSIMSMYVMDVSWQW